MDRKYQESINVKYLATALLIITLAFISYNYFLRQSNKNSNNVISELTNTIREIFGLSNTKDDAGEIDSLAATDTRDSEVAGTTDSRIDNWVATDYKQGDIKNGTYIVKSGDTLWEIAEAVYGNGNQWHKILDANSGSIGFLANGSQALIITGQTLNIP